ncbi:hypothetical protein FACS1894216_18120 [Synergistales bacterium]|nr:hypothetical protein FACS1894216_18120 [Synergistales bacterium]
MLSERRFIQALPSYSKHDAIGGNVRIIDAMLRKEGHISHIAASEGNACDENTLKILSLEELIDPTRDVLIYHMAIGSNNNYVVARLKAFRKIMIFHNITPPSYFRFDEAGLAELCREGEEQLREMSGDFDLAIAVSEFNASALRARGYKNVVTVPLLVDLSFYESVQPDAATLDRYNDGKANILFVGRGAPHKCQHDIVAAYAAFREHCPNSRLILVGGWIERYRARVERIIKDMGLSEHVEIPGVVSDSELKAVYASARLFLCMSEHEGFCVPLIESMYFGVPIMAFAAAAVPETLGDSGVLFFEKDFKAIGGMMGTLTRNSALREKVIKAQSARLRDFDIDKIKQTLLEILAPSADEAFTGGAAGSTDISPLPKALPIRKLLRMNGRELIRHAYVRMLHRLPDAEGESLYFDKLLNGFPPVSLISALRFSPEGQKVGEPVKFAPVLRLIGRLFGADRLISGAARYFAAVRFLSGTRGMARSSVIQLQETEAAFAKNNERLSSMDRVIQEHTSALEAYNERLASLDRVIGYQTSALEAANERQSIMNELFSSMERAVKDQASALVASDERLSAMDKIIQDQTNALEAANERFSSIDKIIQDRTNALETSNERLSSMDRVIQDQASALGAYDERLSAMDKIIQDQANALEASNERQSTMNELFSSMERAVKDQASAFAPPTLEFSQLLPSEPMLKRAEKRVGSPAPANLEDREKAFYSYFSEMWGEGSEEIQRRHYEAYTPHLPLKSSAPFVDIGCGAGEFLSFMQGLGIKTLGVDFNEREIARCRDRGLVAQCADAVDFLEGYEGELSGISLLQVIEHIPMDKHIHLLSLAQKRLTNGGVLIAETINPTHPLALSGFFTDPTHLRPIPSDYLVFLAQWCGFGKVEILRLYPSPILQSAISDPQFHYYNYAIIARKTIGEEAAI